MPMTNTELEARFAFGLALIREAGDRALGFFQRLDSLTVTSKGQQDMMSEADLETETLIRNRIAAAFPGDAFLGEETGRGDVAGSGGIWVVDPIDGTQPFLHGMTNWCVSIAFVAEGVLEMGFVTSPARDELFVGRRGHGATLNGRPIHVSEAATFSAGLVGIGHSPRVTPEAFLSLLGALLGAGGMFVRDGSGALTLCYVACGRLIGYVERHINAWDCLGALAVIEAAGGVHSDILNGDGMWTGNPLVAGPPAMFDVLAALFGEDAPRRKAEAVGFPSLAGAGERKQP